MAKPRLKVRRTPGGVAEADADAPDRKAAPEARGLRQELKAEDFFAGSWTGRGMVSSLFGQPLRAFSLSFQGQRSEDGDILCEESVVYDHGAGLERSWHVNQFGTGVMLGLEVSQGGRMRTRDTRRGFRIRYDRLHLTPGANVARLDVRVWREAADQVCMQGWTRVLGAVPLFRTRVALTSSPPTAVDGLRPAKR